ncbi:hypothetical protein SDC9_206993 [bioreactor metagenome]|uniref:Uncharacterized protein n=1 Tax=bioreactor metagenome TaxID=1076179 RepID=A0A645J815_9ZZZZ
MGQDENRYANDLDYLGAAVAVSGVLFACAARCVRRPGAHRRFDFDVRLGVLHAAFGL